ncbi:MAG: hypothetical protein WBP72_08610 [Rhodocyclaceae bacterium]|jgi:hypothetical protein
MESNNIALAELLFILGIVLFAILSQLKSPKPAKKKDSAAKPGSSAT